MPKSDTTPFAWKDWILDLHEHPLEIEGAWIRICCKLHFAEDRGQMAREPDQWAMLLGVPEEKALDILRYIKQNEIGTVFKGNNGKITVACRRMCKESAAKKQAAIRQQRIRDKKKIAEESRKENAIMTIPLKDDPEGYFVTKKDVLEWKEAFPSVDVMAQLKKLRVWNIDNPKKRKSKYGVRRHINGWLERASAPILNNGDRPLPPKLKPDLDHGVTLREWKERHD